MKSFLRILIGAVVFVIIFGPIMLGIAVVVGVLKAFHDTE